jgi:threonine dehydrogenase-like Zn-dependent dehydrogenase
MRSSRPSKNKQPAAEARSSDRSGLPPHEVGVIGLGSIGSFHATTLLSIPSVESLVVTDLASRRVEKFREDRGADRVVPVPTVDGRQGRSIRLEELRDAASASR